MNSRFSFPAAAKRFSALVATLLSVLLAVTGTSADAADAIVELAGELDPQQILAGSRA